MQIQLALIVLYVAVFSVGTQAWVGTIASLALLLVGCMWLLGDSARYGTCTLAYPHNATFMNSMY